MSQKVIKFKPGWISDDPHCEVPDMTDFKSLSDEVQRIKGLFSTAVTQKVFETRIVEAERGIVDAKQQMQDVVKDISAAITNGEWRDGFKRDVGQALAQLEKRYAAINGELNAKIEEMSKVSELESALSQKILEFQENIKHLLAPAIVNREQLQELEANASIVENADNVRRSIKEGCSDERFDGVESRIALLEKRMRGSGCLTCLSLVGFLIAIVSLIIAVALR